MSVNELVLVLDFGGQYNQLIARRVRECNVYCEVKSYKTSVEEIRAMHPVGIFLPGGQTACTIRRRRLLGGDFLAGRSDFGYLLRRTVDRAFAGRPGAAGRQAGICKIDVSVQGQRALFEAMAPRQVCWMSHTDQVFALPEGFSVTASTDSCPVAAFEDVQRRIYGVQFHPEVNHTQNGTQMLRHFLYRVCKVKGDWLMSRYAQQYIADIRRKIGDKRVLCALSGGVDSSVAAVMISKAVGKQLTCVFLDHGLLRKNEGEEVEEIFTKQFDLNFVRVNCADRFLPVWQG
jgi:GMP synthase (glutamine-hydrolysing)